MKSVLLLLVVACATLQGFSQEDKSKRPSPPASVQATLRNGTIVSIDYSQPSVKGRTIGKDVEPMKGKVWRTGANEATVFEINKDARVEGKHLAAGKYALFTIAGDTEWVLIFNKDWKQWGAFNYKEKEDALRVKVKPSKVRTFAEKMTFTVDKKGNVKLFWGDVQVGFNVSG